jgi:excinuclease ABC subunit C
MADAVAGTGRSAEDIRRRLYREASELPETPGVYIMYDASDRVVYVGKSKKLRNRVSQYFGNSEKTRKTERMVASVRRFECVFCDTEIEALALENVLIKRHSPRFNVKLKDAKSYPYIKLTAGDWPVLRMSRQRRDDGARYFGPYSGSAAVFSVIGQVERVFGLPSCRRRFPEDIGRGRPCVYYQMGRCVGVCTGKVSPEEYAETVAQAVELLRGRTAPLRRALTERMEALSERCEFEAAARCRDAVRALDGLSEKQKAVASPDTYRDAAGIYADGSGAAMSLLCVRGGLLVSKFDFVVPTDVPDHVQACVSLLSEYYRGCGEIPDRLMLGPGFSDDDAELLGQLLVSLSGGAGNRRAASGGADSAARSAKPEASVPRRGENLRLCEMAAENARQALEKEKRDTGKNEETLASLAALLGLEALPGRIEAYDISNIGDEHITAGMIVIRDGRFSPKEYRTFNVRTTAGADDYGALAEVLGRRLSRLTEAGGDAEAASGFGERPDLILLDGGRQHLAVALEAMERAGVSIPAAGMVKDGSHRTRSLVVPEGEVDIASRRELFVFIYRIQEEVHRFSVSKMSAAKRRTVRHSSLEKIPGIGPTKAAALIDAFGSLAAVRSASVEALAGVKGIGERDAEAVNAYFRSKEVGSQ